MNGSYLLDSHAVLWYLTEPDRLSARALAVLEEPANRVLVSDVSLYELMFKAARGRLPAELLRLPDVLEASALPSLSITRDAVRTAATLAWTHGDPWDRLLLAQALQSNLSLVSKDEVFDTVSERRVW